uniref:Cytochrome c oxidase subunit NDUFA4 n=4 Tax=Passeriformes TaxID=9126 RepID=A0A803VVR3_FICAL
MVLGTILTHAKKHPAVGLFFSYLPLHSCWFPNDPRDAPQTGNLCQGFRAIHLWLQLIPLFVIIGSGGVGAGLYLMRLAMFNPDVSWDKKNNPEPWNKMSPSDQYKFVSINMDYSRLKKDRPDF